MSAVLLNPSPEQLTEQPQPKKFRAQKFHLAESSELLVEFTDIVPLCEQGRINPVPVKRAVFGVWVAIESLMSVDDLLENVVGVCHKCRRLVTEEPYLYAIREGQAE